MKDKNIFEETARFLEKGLWAKVFSMEWGRPSFDYKTISYWIHTNWDEQTIKNVADFCKEKVEKLAKAVDTYAKENGIRFSFCDDAKNDLLWHVVGLGEEEYNKTLNNVLRLEARYHTQPYGSVNSYKESFAYCFHKPENKTATPPPNVPSTCWCCGASSEPPTQEEMLRDFGHHLSNMEENALVNFAMAILGDLPEEILESYYIKNILKKVV